MPSINHVARRAGDGGRPMTVMFNGRCTICAPEVTFYQRLALSRGITHISFVDVYPEVRAGTRSVDYLKQFHVDVDGVEYVGIDAFILLWRQLPYFKNMSKIISLPIIYHVGSWTYRRLLAPFLYWRFMRQTRRHPVAAP